MFDGCKDFGFFFKEVILCLCLSFADSSSSLCVLVSTVGKLCRLINEDVSEQVKQVLGPEDLQRYLFGKYHPELLKLKTFQTAHVMYLPCLEWHFRNNLTT
jgi:hypothetical protein